MKAKQTEEIREEYTISNGDRRKILAFLDYWAPKNELVGIYGDPARGFAGRQTLCLRTALTGDPSTRPATCPASVAPAWIAYLVPWWGDSGTGERWSDLMRQIGEIAPRFGELVGETGRRALAGCQLVTLRVALRHATAARPIVERVIALWERVLLGDEPSPQEWEATWAVPRAAEAAEAATWAVSRAAKAAEAATADEIIQGHIDAIRDALGTADGGVA